MEALVESMTIENAEGSIEDELEDDEDEKSDSTHSIIEKEINKILNEENSMGPEDMLQKKVKQLSES
jgi:hypothetical protein